MGVAEGCLQGRNISDVHHAMEVGALDVPGAEVAESCLLRARTVLAEARFRSRHHAIPVVAQAGQAVSEDVRDAGMARYMRHGAAQTAVEKEWCGDERMVF